MTKLCNTCEYLRYCARSGIEEVGCDRYKKDTTTNEEWLKSCNTEQLAEFICEIARDGGDAIKRCNGNFKPLIIYKHSFWEEWLKQPHSEVGK